MSVRVISRRKGGTPADPGETIVTVARPSVFANPFELYSEKDRNKVCDAYEEYMRARFKLDDAFRKAVTKLAKRHAGGARLALQCWCAPKRCHADSLKKLIEEIAALSAKKGK